MTLVSAFQTIAKKCTPISKLTNECYIFSNIIPQRVPYSHRNISLPEGFHAVNWHAELGYRKRGFQPDGDNPLYPRRAQGTGESLGLSLTLDVQADAYYCSSSSSVGFKIALHSPNESPNVRETGVLLAPGMETKLRIDPSKILTEKHLRNVDRRSRRCLFHNELKLRWFAHYTQRNCVAECLSGWLIRHCGCVTFYMPRLNANDTICPLHKRECVELIRFRTIIAMESCLDECLPSCFDLSFSAIAYSTRISLDGFRETPSNGSWNFTDAYVERSVAVVNMYFKDPTFRANKQTEFIGFSDFLCEFSIYLLFFLRQEFTQIAYNPAAGVGGLMGLFLGFSFLSIAECVYFALIRPCRTCSEIRQLNQPRVHQMNLKRSPTSGNIRYISAADWFQAELAHQQPNNRQHFNPA